MNLVPDGSACGVDWEMSVLISCGGDCGDSGDCGGNSGLSVAC